MKIHILDRHCFLPVSDVVRGKGSEWSTASALACREAVRKAINAGNKSIAVDIISFEGGKNRSYVVNSVIECLDDLNESLDIPDDFKVYLADAAKEESRYSDAFELSGKKVVLMNAGVRFDDLKEKFEDYQIHMKAGVEFRVLVYNFMKSKKIENAVDVYKAAGVSKSVFSGITSSEGLEPRIPKRETVAAICIGLRLNLEEAQALYQSAGYYLGTTDFVDRVIRFFIENEIYDIEEVNCCLVHYGKPILGVRTREDRREEREAKRLEIRIGE